MQTGHQRDAYARMARETRLPGRRQRRRLHAGATSGPCAARSPTPASRASSWAARSTRARSRCPRRSRRRVRRCRVRRRRVLWKGHERPMLMKRVIPCLDVHEGRVVKGVNFVNLRDAGDPVEMAALLRRGRRRRARLPRHHRHARGAAHHARGRHAHRRGGASSRTRSAAACARRPTSARCSRRAADKISLNSAAVRRPELITDDEPASTARSASSWRSTPAACPATGRALGGLHQRRTHQHRARRRRVGRPRPSAAAPARSCSRAWTATAPRTATTSR